jgi:hypothetical protein
MVLIQKTKKYNSNNWEHHETGSYPVDILPRQLNSILQTKICQVSYMLIYSQISGSWWVQNIVFLNLLICIG